MSHHYIKFYAIMVYSLSAFFTIGVNVIFFLRARKSQMLTAFSNIQYMIIIWLIANVLKQAAPNSEVAWLWVVLQYLAVCMFGAFFLDFAWLYKTGSRMRLLLRTAIFTVSGLNYIFLFTNPIHGLFYKSYTFADRIPGPVFYFHTFWSYLLLLTAYVILLRTMTRNVYSLSRLQVALFTTGLLLPIVINIVYVWGIVDMSFDLSPVTYNATVIIFGYTAYKYRFLDIKKVSGSQILSNLHEGIVIIDANGRMIYKNPIVRRTVSNYSRISRMTDVEEFLEAVGNEIDDRSSLLYKAHQCIEQNLERVVQEVRMQVNGKWETYLFKMERLVDNVGDQVGYLVRIIDITQHKILLTRVEEKNDALTRINQQLSENITAAKQLAVAKERSRVSKEIHDILGHTMTMVINLLEMAAGIVGENTEEAKSKVGQSREIIRGGLGDLKRSMRKNPVGLIEANVLNDDLANLIEGFEQSGTKVDYYYKKSSVQLSSTVYETIYRICQEGLTNALKHGKAENVTVGLRYVERHIDLFIIDDGQGCDNIVKGNGISGMENRVRDLSGYFSCGSPEGDGFNIHVTLPIDGG